MINFDLQAIRFLPGTKVSHDYEGTNVTTFSYKDLVDKNIECIGIPCKQNRIIVVDVDVEGMAHKKDGREWWDNFSKNNGIPLTYTIKTGSGGYHFYFRLPEAINPDTFSPPKDLAPGVDIKWNGWVAAPPSKGYSVIIGNIASMAVAPPSLMMEIQSRIYQRPPTEYTFDAGSRVSLNLHTPLSSKQIADLSKSLDWVQTNGVLTREEWLKGLFSLKAGIEDPALLQHLVGKWTVNRSFTPGDEEKAHAIIEKADKQGGVGPGTIQSLINTLMARAGATHNIIASPLSPMEIFEKSLCSLKFKKDGEVLIDCTESNAAAIIGAIHDVQTLYHDIRQDFYIFNGKPTTDVEMLNILIPVIQSHAHGLGLANFKKQTIAGGLEVLMNMRQVDPHKEWLKELVWDGIPRIDTFWVNYVGVEDGEYIRAVGKNFWISLAARGLTPGCKFDSMVILEGHEGIRKSSLVQAIGGEYTFAPSTSRVMEDLDELRKMHQSIVVELPEMMGLVNQDSNRVKAFLSKAFDNIRSLYARKAAKQLRGFVFVGTTNSSKYLSADMGARRFWPVKIPAHIKTIDLGAIVVDRQQLFAEAVSRYREGESFYAVPMEDLKQRVRGKTLSEPLIEPMIDIVPILGPSFRLMDIYQRLEITGYVPRGLNPEINKRIAAVLTSMGYEECQKGVGSNWVQSSFSLESFI